MKRLAYIFGTLGILAALAPAVATAQQTGVEGLLLPSPPTTAQPSAPQPLLTTPQVSAPTAQDEQAKRDQDFQRALTQAVPFTPDQITQYRKALDDATKATAVPLAPRAPVSRSIRLSLKPGEASPILRVQPGVVSTLTFSDVTGAAWPVLSVVTGNPNAYVAQSAGESGKTNIIVVSAIQPYIPSNLVVTLVNYPVPVTITLQQDSAQVDYRVDAQIAARGPNASMDMVGTASLAPTNDSNMLSFLDGTPPDAAKRYQTTSADVDAWEFGDMMYVRTPGDVLSPAYVSKASNVSGVNVFVLADAPVILVSRDGRMSAVHINR